MRQATVKAKGRKIRREPNAGNPPVRFDEGELNGRMAVQLPTLLAKKIRSYTLASLVGIRLGG